MRLRVDDMKAPAIILGGWRRGSLWQEKRIVNCGRGDGRAWGFRRGKRATKRRETRTGGKWCQAGRKPGTYKARRRR